MYTTGVHGGDRCDRSMLEQPKRIQEPMNLKSRTVVATRGLIVALPGPKADHCYEVIMAGSSVAKPEPRGGQGQEQRPQGSPGSPLTHTKDNPFSLARRQVLPILVPDLQSWR